MSLFLFLLREHMSKVFNNLGLVATGEKPLQVITDIEFNSEKGTCCRCNEVKTLYDLPFHRQGRKFICSECLKSFQESRLPFLKYMPVNLGM